MVGVFVTAIYHALYGSHRALEERFADLALKVRASQGTWKTARKSSAASREFSCNGRPKRVPVPKPDTPEGEKLARMLIQAGYLKSTMPQVYQVFRFGNRLVGRSDRRVGRRDSA